MEGIKSEYAFSMKERFSNEGSAREIMRQAEKELLDAAGLNEFDTKIIHDFREYGFSAFVHGSLVKSELRDVSDIDFALVGDFSKIPPSVREEFIPRITDEQLSSIDYFSIGRVSAAGRKMSLHVEKAEFREQYPNGERPYAREYRPEGNIKISKASSYLLCGFNNEGASHVFGVICPQEQLNHGVINTIPQTGVFLFEQETMIAQKDPSISIPIMHVVPELGRQEASIEPKAGERVMVLGLELDKIRTDRSLYHGDVDGYTTLPIERTMAMASEFLGGDSEQRIGESFDLLGKYWYLWKTP